MNEELIEQTGGPAFPAFEVRTHDTSDLVANASQGMTLLDYFAAQVVATREEVEDCGAEHLPPLRHGESWSREQRYEAEAIVRYEKACAMIHERRLHVAAEYVCEMAGALSKERNQ